MPRKIINYENSIIYKIVCNDINIKECYIGSTTNFIKRKQAHKSCCNNANDKGYNVNVYKFIRDNNGWSNWSMVLIEELKCDNKLQLEQRERHYIELLQATLNTNIPARTQTNKQYYIKQYYELNKEKINETMKQYNELNKEKIKQYNELNKIKIKEKRKQRYQLNKEKLKESENK